MKENKITHQPIGVITIPDWYNENTFIDYLCSSEVEKRYACNGNYTVNGSKLKLFTETPKGAFLKGRDYEAQICRIQNKDTNYDDLFNYINQIGGLITGAHGAGLFYLFGNKPFNAQYISLDYIERLPRVDGKVITPRVCESDGHGCFYSSLSTRPLKEKPSMDDCYYLTFIPVK